MFETVTIFHLIWTWPIFCTLSCVQGALLIALHRNNTSFRNQCTGGKFTECGGHFE